MHPINYPIHSLFQTRWRKVSFKKNTPTKNELVLLKEQKKWTQLPSTIYQKETKKGLCILFFCKTKIQTAAKFGCSFFSLLYFLEKRNETTQFGSSLDLLSSNGTQTSIRECACVWWCVHISMCTIDPFQPILFMSISIQVN